MFILISCFQPRCALRQAAYKPRGLAVAAAWHGCFSYATWPWRGSLGVAWLTQPRAFTDLKLDQVLVRPRALAV